MKTYPSLSTAKKILEDVIAIRNSSCHPFLENWENEFRQHAFGVAESSSLIASKTAYLKPEKAYVLGLLHDCGKFQDEYANDYFHGLAGYEYMLENGYSDVAQIALSHSFYIQEKKLNSYPYPFKNLSDCKKILSTFVYDDYDLLIQLTDMLNDRGKFCTLEERIEDFLLRMNASSETYQWILDTLYETKKTFRPNVPL